MIRRFLLLFAAATLTVPALNPLPAVAADASEAPASAAPAQEQYRRTYRSHRHYRPHYPTHRRYHRRYYTYPTYRYYPYYYSPPIVYSPPHVVIEPAPVVVEPAPVVVQEPAVVYEPAPVVVQEPAHATPPAEPEDDRFGASFILHFMAQNQSDTDLSFYTIRGAGLLGASGAIRFDVDRNWMLELGLGVLGAKEDGIEQISVPLTLSVLAHLFPDSIIDPFAVAGLGVTFTEYDDPDYGMIEQYTQFSGHLGGGAELNLGRNFVISADLRVLFMQARPERDTVLAGAGTGSDVTIRDGGTVTNAAVVPNEDPDNLSTAFQFMAGAGWRF